MPQSWVVTSESVSDAHPDKLADRISDAVLDRCLQIDPKTRVSCETLLVDDLVVVSGQFEVAGDEGLHLIQSEIEGIVRKTLRDSGYDASFPGIDPYSCRIMTKIRAPAMVASRGGRQPLVATPTGNQGMAFGYACDETPERMPLPIQLAHQLMRRQRELRRLPQFAWMCPDAKAQVAVRYTDGKADKVETVVLSTQVQGNISDDEIEQQVIRHLIKPVIPDRLRATMMRCLVNPAGRFEIGGPKSAAGLTGRKIVVDTYGGACPHGGGAFSGKDPGKVDRTGAYAARWIAKHVVAAGAASRCTVQLAYAIGHPKPISIRIDPHGTGRVDPLRLEQIATSLFDLTPSALIRDLGLHRPIYANTAAFGHFGREEPGFPWESLNRLHALRDLLGSH